VDDRNYRPKHVELIEIINKLLLHLVGCLYYCINDARLHKHQTNLYGNLIWFIPASPYTKILTLPTLDGLWPVELAWRFLGQAITHAVETVWADRCVQQSVLEPVDLFMAV